MDELPLLIGGKSMGGRVAAMLANDEELNLAVKGVVVFGYPFHPIGKSEPEHWRLEAAGKSLLPISSVRVSGMTLAGGMKLMPSICHSR